MAIIIIMAAPRVCTLVPFINYGTQPNRVWYAVHTLPLGNSSLLQHVPYTVLHLLRRGFCTLVLFISIVLPFKYVNYAVYTIIMSVNFIKIIVRGMLQVHTTILKYCKLEKENREITKLM